MPWLARERPSSFVARSSRRDSTPRSSGALIGLGLYDERLLEHTAPYDGTVKMLAQLGKEIPLSGAHEQAPAADRAAPEGLRHVGVQCDAHCRLGRGAREDHGRFRAL